jgi:Flp pilus assembly pilin Flp
MSKRVETQQPQVKSQGRPSLLRDARGLTTVEYIIILCLIAVVGFGVWQRFGGKVRERVDNSTTQVDKLPTATDEGAR